eukprot:TRINITY_DN69298_c0_g1_i1.p1 TRINITY_DN69298_c0_g1~~TRINITY_DN69298_c0_g1_i1.p1  ORF type:complete len:518 (+),score=58.01 TRINITY_DN69298_c0_g1_i1:209-1555(+)
MVEGVPGDTEFARPHTHALPRKLDDSPPRKLGRYWPSSWSRWATSLDIGDTARKLDDMTRLGREVRFYAPCVERGVRSVSSCPDAHDMIPEDPVDLGSCDAGSSLVPGARSVNVSNSTLLNPFEGWLWDNNEYTFPTYFARRLGCDLRVVASPAEADFCFPSCNASAPVRVRRHFLARNGVNLEVPLASRTKWSNCSHIGLRVEVWGDEKRDELPSRCLMTFPYMTGIASPRDLTRNLAEGLWQELGVTPWTKTSERRQLLCYVGSVARGFRQTTFNSISVAAWLLNPEDPRRLFSPLLYFSRDDVRKSRGKNPDAFFRQLWELYAGSQFSWQPGGDSFTRRGFYDSWIFGCIPVISVRAADSYRRLFGGAFFEGSLESFVVVLADEVFKDGTLLLRKLQSIPEEEIAGRRAKLEQLAPLLQWGWQSDMSDALTVGIGALVQQLQRMG